MSMHDHSSHEGPQGSFLTSRAGLVLLGFLVDRRLSALHRAPRARPRSSVLAAAVRLRLHALVHAWRGTAGMAGTELTANPMKGTRHEHARRQPTGSGAWSSSIRLVFILFAYSFFKPSTGRDWRSGDHLVSLAEGTLTPLAPILVVFGGLWSRD